MSKKFFKIEFLIILVIAVFTSCKNEVIVNRYSIYSSSWDKGNFQGFNISRIILADTNYTNYKEIFSKIHSLKFNFDTTFCYSAGLDIESRKSNYTLKRFLFNNINEGFLWYKCSDLSFTKKSIGLLDLNSWYLITGLMGTEDIYVFIDKKGEAHSISSGLKNF